MNEGRLKGWPALKKAWPFERNTKLSAISATSRGHHGEVLGISYIQKTHSNEGMVSQRRLAISWIHLASSSRFVVRTLMDGVMRGSGVGILVSFRIA